MAQTPETVAIQPFHVLGQLRLLLSSPLMAISAFSGEREGAF